jgi:hypothetical protein
MLININAKRKVTHSYHKAEKKVSPSFPEIIQLNKDIKIRGMLAIIQSKIFCLPVLYKKPKD